MRRQNKTANKLQLANSNKTLEQVLKEKKSFQLYKDSLKILSKLTDEQAGRLLKAMVIFNNGEPVKLDEILSFVFFPFENQFIRDAEKYYITSEIRKEIGRLGGAPKGNKNAQKTTKNNHLVEKQAKQADKEKDKDKDKDKERENKHTHPQFFDFSFYKTNYNDLPDEIKQSTESSLWRLWQQFNTHIDEKCENLRLISQQMNFLEYLEYRQAFIKSGKISVPMCLKIISDLNNHKPASEKYVSVYPALVKWTEQQISFKD